MVGTTLLIAITVALAVVIATLVSNLREQGIENERERVWSWSYDSVAKFVEYRAALGENWQIYPTHVFDQVKWNAERIA